MGARVSALSLLIAASLADGSSAHSAAFYFLLAAVPVTGVGGLMACGDLVETRELGGKIVAGAQALLSFLTLALVIVVVGSSSGPLLDVPVPALGISALGACLAVFVVQAVLGVIGRALHHPLRLYARAGEDFATADHIGL
jgi:hypothetical protein